jgi:hypothetical protein
MAEKNLVEEALIQIQNLEEAINENAKEILHSTMKEEISELVKESMKNEAEEEDEFEVEDELESEDDSEEDEFEFDDESEEDESEDEDSEESFDMSNFSDISGGDDFESDEIMDLSNHSLEDVLKAYKQMSPDDSFEIKKEGDFIHLKDEEDEYLIQTESEEEEFGMEEDNEEESEEIVYEIEMDDEAEEELDEMYGGDEHDYKRRDGHKIGDVDGHYKDFETMEEGEEEEEYTFEEDVMYESKSVIKPKVGTKGSVGKAKFNYEKSKGGFNEKKSHANPTKGTSKPKFEFKEGEMFDMPSPKGVKKFTKEEAKEASRTYGFGSKEGRGLRKGVTPNRNLTFENREIMEEVEMLKAKNEEYRKALNMFRDKLNEVAVFNSNLAYATRLFTEHSTSKQEKINVLRRFDSAETLKESKALYKTIKDELGGETKKFMTESIERVIDKAPQSGSAVNLIESKTYENPQFLRMKDIMSKIIK